MGHDWHCRLARNNSRDNSRLARNNIRDNSRLARSHKRYRNIVDSLQNYVTRLLWHLGLSNDHIDVHLWIRLDNTYFGGRSNRGSLESSLQRNIIFK